ncbi:MAG: hypothetical protein ACI9C1_002027 [Candidatus Aldehydirespiratoraceae bacterium]|jgi:hypothetical protein
MGITKRMLAVLAAITLIAAACGDNSEEDQATIDEVVDELIDESPAAEPEPEAEPEAEPESDEPEAEPEPEPEPEAATPVDSCVVLHHYQLSGSFEAPYHTTVFIEIDLTGDEVIEVVNLQNGQNAGTPGKILADSWPTNDVDGIGLIAVRFEVWGPGDVLLPQILIDGEPLHEILEAQFWDGNDGFAAAGADIRDEEIYPVGGCAMSYMVQADTSALGFG